MPLTMGNALRIVMFGMPAAGKSSLLGALAESARTQEHLLNGHLTDLGNGLAEMHRRLYENSPRQTLEELLPFPVAFESFARPNGKSTNRLEAVLIDCDGRVANDLLTRRRALDSGRPNASLGAAILEADTLLLVVDASAGPEQMAADFAEFGRFLHLLEQHRGQRTDIGGLPVFLVLTKCDLLAESTDTTAAWLARIDAQKDEVGRRFRDFLAQDRKGNSVPFGRIDLHPWATAVKRPALSGSPPRPHEPFGVAELFREAFEKVKGFRESRDHSQRRLIGIAAGAAGAIVIIAGFIVTLLMHRPQPATHALEAQVDRQRAQEQDQSPKTRHKQVKARIEELILLMKDPAFATLSAEKQDYVADRLKEMQAYRTFEEQVDAIPDPIEARDDNQLQSIKERVNALAPPEQYQRDWLQTDASTRLAERKEDVDALTRAAADTRQAYQKLIQEGTQVLDQKNEPNLPRRAKEVLDKARTLPDPKSDRDKLVPGSKRIPYSTVFGFAGIEPMYQQWDEEVKKKLQPFAKLEQP